MPSNERESVRIITFEDILQGSIGPEFQQRALQGAAQVASRIDDSEDPVLVRVEYSDARVGRAAGTSRCPWFLTCMHKTGVLCMFETLCWFAGTTVQQRPEPKLKSASVYESDSDEDASDDGTPASSIVGAPLQHITLSVTVSITAKWPTGAPDTVPLQDSHLGTTPFVQVGNAATTSVSILQGCWTRLEAPAPPK